jgi:hypothetical protein
MEEKRYRESRLCRVLANPIVYQIVRLLEAGGPLTPSKLAKLIGRQSRKIRFASHLCSEINCLA